jgi:hypothetical protein
MIGLNAGLIGSARTSRRGAAVGLWTPNEQVIYQRQNIWIGDASFDNVSLLLHMNGSNGSTTFTDSSKNALAVTANGNAQISTAQNKFGGASAIFDGTGDYLTSPSNAIFDLGANYTIEFWVYPNSTASNFGLIHRGFYNTATNVWTGLAFSIRCVGSNTLRFYFYGTLNSNEQFIDVSAALSTNAWSHVAMVRSGTTGYVFINGTQSGTITNLNTPAASSETLRIGRWDYSAGNEDFNGYIDDIRITKGTARYTANFTAPAAPFPDS